MSKEIYENPDLKKERQNCPFNKEEITNLCDGGVEKTEERRQLGNNNCFYLDSSTKLRKFSVLLKKNTFYLMNS